MQRSPHRSQAIGVAIAQPVSPIDGVALEKSQDHKSDTKNFTILKFEQNESFINAPLFNTVEFTPGVTDLAEVGAGDDAVPGQSLEVQISQTPINPPTSPETDVESFSETQETLSPVESPEPNPESSSPTSQGTPEPSQSLPEPQPTASQPDRWHFFPAPMSILSTLRPYLESRVARETGAAVVIMRVRL